MSAVTPVGENGRRSVFERVRSFDTRVLDIGATLLLTALGLGTVLARTSSEGFRSDDLLGLVLVLGQTAPLAFRRYSPLGVLVLITIALVAHSALGYEVVQAGTFGSLVALYGATASTDSRGSAIAAGITAVAIVGFFGANRGGYSLVDVAATSATWAMGWFLGTFVKLEGRVRARTRELQSLLEMSRSVTSTLDLRQLYEVALDQLHELIPYTGAAIQETDAGGTRQVAARRPPEIEGEPIVRLPAWSQTSIVADLNSGKPVIIADVRGDEPKAIEYRATIGKNIEETPLRYFRSWMSVPLQVRDKVIGNIGIVHERPSYFGPQHVNLAMSVANHVAIAIENARLFEESARRARELETLLDTSRAVASTLDLQQLFETALDRLRDLIPYSGAGISLRFDDQRRVGANRRPGGDRAPVERRSGWLDSTMMTTLRGGTPVLIDDMRGPEPFATEYRAWLMTDIEDSPVAYVRSLLAVPLIVKGSAIGDVTLTHERPAYFRQEHVHLVQTVANHLAVAIENARLFEESTRRTRNLQALLEMSQAVTSTLDLRALFEVALDKLRELIPYTGASLGLRVGNETRQVTSRRPQGIPRDPVKRTPNWEALPIIRELLSGKTLVIADVRSDDPKAVEFRSSFAEDLETSHMRYIRSIVTVPLMVKSTVIGDLSVTHEQPGFFRREHIELAQSVANHLAIAIENARLFEETDRKAKELEALYQADAKLFGSLDLDDVLQSLADIAVDVLGADRSLVSISEGADSRMVPRAWRNISPETREFYTRHEPGSGKPGFSEGGVVATALDELSPETRPVLEKEGIASTLDVPIVFEGRTRGAFGLAWSGPHESSESEKSSAKALAQRAAVAIQNAELYARAQQAASLEERQRLARELHDSVSQALYGIALGARTARTQLDREPAMAAEPMDYVLSLAEAGLAEMRALIFELRPESLETEGLVAALEKQLAAARARHGLSVTGNLGSEPEAVQDVKEAAYRIAQEALHNVVKHAQARSVRVDLIDSPEMLVLTVADDGRGFDPGGDYPGHMGLRSMQERAAGVRGTLSIESSPGHGSTISVRFPKS